MLRGEGEGDRLVKETARALARRAARGRLLARLDGVEFALILPGCGLGEAVEVLDRVRGATPRGQTASAGVARWDGEEPAELLMLRAQDALGGREVVRPQRHDPGRVRLPARAGFRAGLQKSALASCTASAPEMSTAESLSPPGGRNGGPKRPWSGRWGESPPCWWRSAGLREPDS